MARMKATDRLRKHKKSTYRRIPICLDAQYELAWKDAREALETIQRRFVGRAPSRAEQDELESARLLVEEAKLEYDEHSVVFHISSLGPKTYDKLISDHPPTDEQKREAKRAGGGLSWNVDTFPPALVQACASIVDTTEGGKEVLTPLDEETVEWMFTSDDWSAGELGRLTNTCYEVNLGLRNVGALGNG